MLSFLPKYFTKRAIGLYFISIIVISGMFMNQIMNPLWMLIAALSVVGFFYFSNLLTRKWQNYSTKLFLKKVFWTAFGIRAGWVVISYFLYIYFTGIPFEFGVADAGFYNEIARYGSELLGQGKLNIIPPMVAYSGGLDLSDTGYPVYLSIVYLLTGKSILLARIIKALWSAWTVVLIFQLTKRNFGESTGRIAAILAMLMPNLIYYTGMHLKEVEMVFLTVAFIERADHLLRSNKFGFVNIAVPLLLAVLLFFFRTVLGAAALFALFTALLFSSARVIGWGKRIVIGIWVVVAVGYFLGGRIANEVEEVWADRHMNQQQSYEWRAQREGGNTLAGQLNKAIFLPLIFNIPIPTMVQVNGQENQMIIHGGNFVKEILVFFVLIGVFVLLREKIWKEHLLMITFILSYLLILAQSAFAQSERFHQPALPFILILAAFGVSQITNKQKKYFTWYMGLLIVMFVGWQWFKLAGRGMV